MRLLLITLILLSGCATSAGYDRRLAGYKGKAGSDLVLEWGVPDRTLNFPDGKRGYEYREVNGIGATCRTTFIMEAGTDQIESYSFEGGFCVSP